MKIAHYLLLPLALTCFAIAQDRLLETKKFNETYYEPKVGYSIDAAEQQKINDKGSSPVYGEITPEGASMLIKEYDLKDHDVFYDLGCGVGKLVFQVFRESNAKKCAGVELSPTRIKHAQEVKAKNKEFITSKNGRQLDFYEQNFLDAPLNEATALYVASTCFSNDFMTKLAKKLSALKPGLKLVTLTQLPVPYKFKLVKQMTIPMSWSPHTTAYFYVLQDSTEKPK